MSTDVLADILTSLDVVVLERLPDGVFLRLGSTPPPAWFQQVFADPPGGAAATIAGALPFLAHFLTDAEEFWRPGGDGRLRSESFTIADSSGAEIGLAASALAVGGRRFLVLERPADFEEHRRALQNARESALAHEEHVRRTGELLSPVDAARALAQQFAATGVTEDQQRIIDELSAQLAALARAIESLAPLPKGVARRRR